MPKSCLNPCGFELKDFIETKGLLQGGGQRARWKLCLCGCSCCCGIIGLIVGIVIWSLKPKPIESFGVCYVNVCGHGASSASLRRYANLDFSPADEMSEACSQDLQDRLLAGGDLTAYVGVWLKNPNDMEASISTLTATFSRADTKDKLGYCTAEPFVAKAGELFLRLSCTLPSSSRRAVEGFVSEFTQCRELGIEQRFELKADIGGWTVGGLVVKGPIAYVNPGGQCADKGGDSSSSLDWLGNDASCKGTTDVSMKSPSIYFCSVRGFSVSSLYVEIELEVFNPTLFSASITQLKIDIYPTGSETLVGTVEKAALSAFAVSPKSTTVFMIKGNLKSTMGALQVSVWQSVDITGTVGVSVLGFNLMDIRIARKTVKLYASEKSETNDDVRSWSETISDSVDMASQAAGTLLGYMQGSCQCIFNCVGQAAEAAVGQVCAINTGGTCAVNSCSSSRQAQCSYGRCMCKDTECAVNGACVDRASALPPAPPGCVLDTGGTCSVLSCASSRQATCIGAKCMCQEGKCSVNGACVR